MSHRKMLECEHFRQGQEISYLIEGLYLHNLMEKVIYTIGETHLYKITLISLLTF